MQALLLMFKLYSSFGQLLRVFLLFHFQMTFLEFFEALIGCAEKYVTLAVVKDPSTPRPSTSVTKDESMYSIPGSPSRLTSQVSITEEFGLLASDIGQISNFTKRCNFFDFLFETEPCKN